MTFICTLLVYCYLLGAALRHIIQLALSGTNHSFDQKLNGIVVCCIIFIASILYVVLRQLGDIQKLNGSRLMFGFKVFSCQSFEECHFGISTVSLLFDFCFYRMIGPFIIYLPFCCFKFISFDAFVFLIYFFFVMLVVILYRLAYM